VTVLLYLAIFAAGGFIGLITGAVIGANARDDLLDELEAAEAEVDRLRGRAG